MDLDTPLSNLLRATYDLELPARFYNPRTLKRIQDVSLIKIYETGKLSIDNIAASFILDNISKAPDAIISTLKDFGLELLTRFGVENRYTNYSLAELLADRATWETTLKAQKSYERLLSSKIDEINSQYLSADFPVFLLSKPDVQQSNLVFTQVSWNTEAIDLTKLKTRDLQVQPIINRVRLTNEDALDVFSLIPVTSDPDGIPYLGYHTPLANHYRVSINPDSASIHPDRDEYTYRIILDSDLYSDLKGSTAFLSFIFLGIFCLLDLSHSTLILNRINSESEDVITEKIKSKLSFLNIEALSHRHITARIISPIGGPINYNLFVFDAMLNQEEYIGFKEEEIPVMLKPTNLFYLSPIPRVIDPLTDEYAQIPEIKVEISKATSVSSQLLTLSDKSKRSVPFELTSGTSYAEFTVFDVIDTELLKFTVSYLSRMVGHYHEVVVKEYSKFIEDDFRIPLTSSHETLKEISSGKGVKPIDVITHSYPEVFANNYTRRCPHYPIVKDKLDSKDREFSLEDKSSKDKWLRFPPDGNIDFYFKCGTRETQLAYPGVVVSNLRNKAKYPLLPCCFRSEQFKNGQRTEIAYKLGGATASSIKLTDITISSWGPLNFPPSYNRRLLMTSDKVLSRGRLGMIPQSLLTVLMSNILVSEDDDDNEDYKILRLGLSEQTMLHAAFLAADTDYQKLSTSSVEQRSKYIESRLKTLPSAALTQEAQDEINYRIIEETLDINLYVIIRVPPPENVIRPNHYFFEVPKTRSGEPHMRRHDLQRPSVILYKIRKFEADIPTDSGYELLLFTTPTQLKFSGLWGLALTSQIANLYTRSNQVVSFGTSPIDPDSYGKFVGYYTGDYRSLVPDEEALSQIIDERGLCRALNFKNFSLVFPPTQPYILESSSKLQVAESYENSVRKTFGTACLVSSQNDGVFYITGNSYVFIPCLKIESSHEIPVVGYTPLTGLTLMSSDYNVRWRKAYVQLKILLFLVSFLYAFSATRNPDVSAVTNSINFMERYVLIDEKKHKASISEIYDFSNLKRVFILKELTIKAAFSMIERFVPSLLNETKDKIVVTSRKIYDGLEYFIRTVAEQTATKEMRKSRWELGRILESSLLLDEKEDITTLYFNSPGYVRTWFKGTKGQANTLTVNVKSVFDVVKSGTGVVLWRHPVSQRMWMIPGVTYSFRNAAAVCYLWITQHRVIELESHGETLASIEKLQSGGFQTKAGMTIFRNQRRSRSRTRTRLIVGSEDDTELISEAKRIIDSEEGISIFTYVITRDNRIELLNDGTQVKEINLEVLRTATDRFTPMLSP